MYYFTDWFSHEKQVNTYQSINTYIYIYIYIFRSIFLELRLEITFEFSKIFKKYLGTKSFLVKLQSCKALRTPILRNTLKWLLWKVKVLWDLILVSTTQFGFYLVEAWLVLIRWSYLASVLENKLNLIIVNFVFFTE